MLWFWTKQIFRLDLGMLLALVFVGLAYPVFADEPAGNVQKSMSIGDAILMAIRMSAPMVLAMAGPYLVKGLQWVTGAVGDSWRPVLSLIFGAVISAGTAAGLGNSPEMVAADATIGTGVAGVTHKAMQGEPIPEKAT